MEIMARSLAILIGNSGAERPMKQIGIIMVAFWIGILKIQCTALTT